MQNKWKIILSGALLIGAFLLGYGMRPKPEIKIVEKIVRVKDYKEKIRVVEKPDGTKVTEIDRTSKEEAKEDKSFSQVPAQRDWLVGVAKNVAKDEYSATIGRRIFSGLYLTGQINSQIDIAVGLQIQF